jgi:hypothetical protein
MPQDDLLAYSSVLGDLGRRHEQRTNLKEATTPHLYARRTGHVFFQMFVASFGLDDVIGNTKAFACISILGSTRPAGFADKPKRVAVLVLCGFRMHRTKAKKQSNPCSLFVDSFNLPDKSLKGGG